MLTVNAKPSEAIALVANVDPDAYAANSYDSGWVDASKFHAFLAVLQMGDLGSSATVLMKFQQASNSGGTGAEDITDKVTATFTQAGTDYSNKQALLHLRPDEMVGALLSFKDGTATHIRIRVTVGVATSDVGAALYGVIPRQTPTSSIDASSVVSVG